MRIDNGLTNPVSNGNGLGSVGQVGSNPRTPGTSAEDRSFDNVTLSDASNLVDAAKNSSAVERQAKLASLTAQVRSGSYRFDAQAVSQSLINSLR